jgi:CO/xanthine dehydrogenase FAD-binding subunit
MMCLNATYQVAGKSGERRIQARQFYQGAYFSALEPGEILTAIRIRTRRMRGTGGPTTSSSARSATMRPRQPLLC